MRWPFYSVTDNGQSMLFEGVEIDPNGLRCGCEEDVLGLNLARARRLTGRRFPGRRFTVTDALMVAEIRSELFRSSRFVARMDDLAASRRAGKQAMDAISVLKELLK